VPTTEVLLYREEDGTVPLVDWLDRLTPKAQARCLARLKARVPERELRAALRRKAAFETNPARHTFRPEK
jgi:hypothetical protein